MRIVSILTLLFVTSISLAQKGNKIAEIRKSVERINRDSGYVIKKVDGETFLDQASDNGGQLTAYFRNGQLVKMIEWVGLSSCVDIIEYYLQDDKLIFTYTSGSEAPYVDSLQSFDQGKLNKTMECRFYFDNGIIIKSILKGSTRCGGQPTVELGENYLTECFRIKKLLTRK